MSWWQKWLKYWRGADLAQKATKDMSIEDLEAEYRVYHSEVVMSDTNQQEDFRASAIEDELKRRGIYINKDGVDVYFVKN